MTFLKSVPDDASLLDILRRWPEMSRPMYRFAEAVMCGPGPLSRAERELIAAYVSALNACRYCYGIHAETAQALGMAEATFEAGLDDVDALPVARPMKAALGYVRKLTLEPAKVTARDAEAVHAAGWDDAAFHRIVMICGLFNLYNRIVDGQGVIGAEGYWQQAGRRVAEKGYVGNLGLDPA